MHRREIFRSLWGCKCCQVQICRSVLGYVNHWKISAMSRYILKIFWSSKLFGEVPLASMNLKQWITTTTTHYCCMWRELSWWNTLGCSLTEEPFQKQCQLYYRKCLAHPPCNVNLFRMCLCRMVGERQNEPTLPVHRNWIRGYHWYTLTVMWKSRFVLLVVCFRVVNASTVIPYPRWRSGGVKTAYQVKTFCKTSCRIKRVMWTQTPAVCPWQ